MNRRNFFKMVGTLAVSAAVAPLSKYLPEPQERGLSLRLMRDYDPVNEKLISRVDTLYGFGNLPAESRRYRQIGGCGNRGRF